MRNEFEKLPEISLILHDDIFFNDVEYYSSNSLLSVNVACLNAALYAFQEQQKKIDQHNRKLKMFIDELRKTHNDDKGKKIDYWRGFSECADSSAKVFLRDVGFIDLGAFKVKIKQNKIIFEHGFIDVVLNNGEIMFNVEYDRIDIAVFKQKSFELLQDAYEWYNRVDLNCRCV